MGLRIEYRMRDAIADYNRQAQAYSRIRTADPRIEAVVYESLGTAHQVLNLSAGNACCRTTALSKYQMDRSGPWWAFAVINLPVALYCTDRF